MAMSKKDFIAIAAVIKGQRPPAAETPYSHGREAACNDIAICMANILADTNPAFQRWTFLAACGVPE